MFPTRNASFNIIELDCETKAISETNSRLEVTVTFNSIPIRVEIVESKDYYVGTTGATVNVNAKGARFVEYTEPPGISVGHETKKAEERGRSGKFAPELKATVGHVAVQTNPGALESSAKTNNESSISYEFKEFPIVPIKKDGSLAWQIDMPRGEKAVRDFLLGNLPLSVTLEWRTTEEKSGTVQARPSSVLFFDEEKRALPIQASLLMRFILWKRGIRFPSCEGIEKSF
jgi:hypothetical protein